MPTRSGTAFASAKAQAAEAKAKEAAVEAEAQAAEAKAKEAAVEAEALRAVIPVSIRVCGDSKAADYSETAPDYGRKRSMKDVIAAAKARFVATYGRNPDPDLFAYWWTPGEQDYVLVPEKTLVTWTVADVADGAWSCMLCKHPGGNIRILTAPPRKVVPSSTPAALRRLQ